MDTTEVNIKNWKSLIKPPKLDINLSDDKKFDQMFLTNSVLKVMPVSRFEEKKFIKNKNVRDLINFFKCQNDAEKIERLNLI